MKFYDQTFFQAFEYEQFFMTAFDVSEGEQNS